MPDTGAHPARARLLVQASRWFGGRLQVHRLFNGHIALYAFASRLPMIQHHFDLDHERTVSMPIAVSGTQLRGRENGKARHAGVAVC